ncbi:hypothetical protein L2E82_26332 [Cichorium intybus]|uniref:Uncharacterized protein n=1 Tax=Cichorium intybus TaxID=13427 RepID=A0ACB9CQE2_CICIN|nr:hypothetical protein L2E82_26332 [Cichorium intybus]
MAGHLLLASAFAFVVGFLLLYAFFVIKNSQKHLSIGTGSNKTESASTGMETTCMKCECQSADDFDVIIVGAGVAGTALAHSLGKEGRRVHLIERDLKQPDRIVGEVLQPGGYRSLIELGLKDCVEDIDAQRVVGYALFKDGKSTRLPYPLSKFDADVAGRGFHNGRFIQKMRDKASLLPNIVLEQGTVSCLVEEQGLIKGVVYRTKAGEERNAYAPLTIVCDGCLVLQNCQLPYEKHGHVIIAEPSPIVFYPISSTEIRCLVDIPGQKVPSVSNGDLSKYLKTVVAPQPVASTINTLAEALYKVFCNKARQEMQEACFKYLSLGGIFSNGPISLISGLYPCPLSLILHFFAVAVYGVDASRIVFPIIKAEGFRQTFFPATVPAYYRSPPDSMRCSCHCCFQVQDLIKEENP